MYRYKTYLKVFLISFISMLITMLPVMIMNKGYFIYMGDYNYQHIIFNAHCYRIVRDGFSLWDPVIGLGGDVLSSYSHIIMTPFFLFVLLMPSVKSVILSLPFLNSFKTAVAAITSYAYIRRYTRTDHSAIVGAMLYAFSGFQTFSFIFGSFHDVTAWFPLMLLCIDEYMMEGRKGFFALIVAFMAALNAFFFYGQVFFLIIYFILKCVTKEYRFTLKKFVGLFFEAVIGVLISCILLYPSVISLSSSSRVSEFIYGMDALSYSDSSIPWRIIQSLFMMPDKAGDTSLFAGNADTTWSSLSLYLPVTGIVFVYGYIKRNIKKAFSVIVLISLIFSLIPVLNSIFFMFNSEYYARWFYMPILIMSVMTAIELENEDSSFSLSGIKVSGICMTAIALIACLPDKVYEKENPFLIDSERIEKVKMFAFANDPIYFWRMLGISGLCLLIIYFILIKTNAKKVKNIFSVCICGIVIMNIIYINDVRGDDTSVTDYDVAFLETPVLTDTDDEYYRTYGYNYNANVLWNIPGLDDFITTKPDSVCEFYDQLGIPGIQTMYIDYRYYPVYALMSVKYYLNPSTKDELNVEYHKMKIKGFTEMDEQPCYHIYENDFYIPVGFTYDRCIRSSKLNDYIEEYGKTHPTEKTEIDYNDVFERFHHSGEYNFEKKYLQKLLVMMRALVLSDEDAEKYSNIIPEISDEDIQNLDEETYYADSKERSKSSCSEFRFNGNQFNAKIKSDKDNLVFFSVPYMEGWSAKVNGEDAEVVKVNYGFMAVKVDEGDNDIVFSYENPNYITGGIISCVGLGLFAVYMIVNYMIYKRKDRNEVKG